MVVPATPLPFVDRLLEPVRHSTTPLLVWHGPNQERVDSAAACSTTGSPRRPTCWPRSSTPAPEPSCG